MFIAAPCALATIQTMNHQTWLSSPVEKTRGTWRAFTASKHDAISRTHGHQLRPMRGASTVRFGSTRLLVLKRTA